MKFRHYIFLFQFILILSSCEIFKPKTTNSKLEFNKTVPKGIILTQRFYSISKKNGLEEIAEGAPPNSDNFGLYYSSKKYPGWVRLNVIKNANNVGINFNNLVVLFPNDKTKYTINWNESTKELILKDEKDNKKVFKKE